MCSFSIQEHFNNRNVTAFHDLRSNGKHVNSQEDEQVFWFLQFVYLSCVCLSAVSRSQAQQRPEVLPELEVSKVFPRPRTAEDHSSQSVSPRRALWVKNISNYDNSDSGCLNQDIWLRNCVFNQFLASFLHLYPNDPLSFGFFFIYLIFY